MNENIGPIEAQTPGEEAAAAGQTGAAAERLTW